MANEIILPGWRDIKTAPKYGVAILAVIPGYRPSICQWVIYGDKAQWFHDPEIFATHEAFVAAFENHDYRPTLWTELPEA